VRPLRPAPAAVPAAVSVPESILSPSAGQQSRMVFIEYDGTKLSMFLIDLLERADRIDASSE
jgi:hypothetical protein